LTSDRRHRANRANAKSSTGPKTSGGKTRAAQNAFRHGLSVPVMTDPALAPEVEVMARKISGSYADAETLERARRIAEAQIYLFRVRNSRRSLIAGLLADLNYQPVGGDEKLAAVLGERVSQLAAFERYERRAASRRKFAIRTFDESRCHRRAR
jgi:hypothetical protein